MPWGALGGLLLASWGALGCFGCLLGAPWCLKVVFWCPSGVLWGALGVSRVPLGAPRWSFGPLVGDFLAPLVPSGAFVGGPRGFSRILVAFPRPETQQQKKEQSKRKRDTSTRTQHPLQNRASRSMTHRFKRSAHSARPRSLSTQCCLRVAVAESLSRCHLHRLSILSLGFFGVSFWVFF